MAEYNPDAVGPPLNEPQTVIDNLVRELDELREFTMYEQQFLRAEKGHEELEEENLRLQNVIIDLNGVIQRHEHTLENIRNEIHQKKTLFVRLKDDQISLNTFRPDDEPPASPPLIDDVLNSFATLLNFIETDSDVEEDARHSKTTSPNELGPAGEISLQTSGDILIPSNRVEEASNLVDPPNVVTEVEGCNSDSSNLDSIVEELERKLQESKNQCQLLTKAYEDLEMQLEMKENEIQKLYNGLDVPSLPCVDRKSSVEKDQEYDVGCSNLSAHSVINSSALNASSLPTIYEVKESSFEGSFNESNVSAPLVPVDLETTAGVAALNIDNSKGLLEIYQGGIADLQKCRGLLADELKYCLSELSVREEQISLLQSTLPVAVNSRIGTATSSDLFIRCKDEIEALETVVGQLTGNINNESDAEITGRLFNVITLIHKWIDSFSVAPNHAASEESSLIDMTLSNTSSNPLQFCSVMLESTMNVSASDSSLAAETTDSRFKNNIQDKPDVILKEIRNLRNSIESISSDVVRELFNAVGLLDRVESIICCYRKSQIEALPNDSTKALNTYKNVLIEDIREKAQHILDLHKSLVNSSCSVSPQNSTTSLPKFPNVGSARSHTNSSFCTASDGDEACLHFMCPTDNKCDGEAQTSFEFADVKVSNENDLSCYQDESDYLASTNIMAGQSIDSNTILSVFLKTIQDFEVVLQSLDNSTPEMSKFQGDLSLEKVETYAKSVINMLNLRTEMLGLLVDHEKIRFDPNSTKLMSLDVSSLNDDFNRKPLRSSNSIPAFHTDDDTDDAKENCPEDKVSLSRTIKNWKKLIHDSNKRIAELKDFNNTTEMKLSEKIVENNNLKQQLSVVSEELKSLQEAKREEVEDLNNKLETTSSQWNALISSAASEIDQLVDVKLTKELAEKSRLAVEIADVTNLNQQLSVVNEELKSLQEAKREEVEDLKNKLETTTSQWNALISSAASEIDELKTAKMLVEVELAKELAEKSRLAEEVRDVNNLNQQLEVVREELKALQKSKREEVEDLKNQLETTTSQWNALISSAASEIDQLKTAKMLVEVQLAKELAEKSRLAEEIVDINNLNQQLEIVREELKSLQEAKIEEVEDLKNQLETATSQWNALTSSEIDELKTAKLMMEVELAKEVAEKSKLADEIVDVNNLNQQLTVVNEELKSLQKAKLEEVADLKNKLETTTSQWNALISSTASEIDQLKTAKMLVEVELANEVAEKSKLGDEIVDVNNLNQQLDIAREELKALQKSKREEVEDLKNQLETTSSLWKALISSAASEIDQLKTAKMLVEVQLAKELAEKSRLAEEIVDVNNLIQQIEIDHEELMSLQVAQKEEVEDLKNQLRTATSQWNAITSSEIDELKTAKMMMEVELAKELAEKSKLTHEIVDVKNLNQQLSVINEELRQELETTTTQWNSLIFSAASEIDQLKTAKMLVEVELAKELAEKSRLAEEIVDVNNLNQQLEIVREELRSLQEAKREEVEELKTKLETTTSQWNALISSAALEIDQLKTAKMLVEVELAKELAEKSRLADEIVDVNNLNQQLSVVNEELRSLQEVKTEEVEELKTKLETTTSQWNALISSAALEIDHLKTAKMRVDIELAKELAEKSKLAEEIVDVGNLNQQLEIVLEELKSLQEAKMEEVADLKNKLETTTFQWNALISSAALEIDELKTAKMMVEVELTKELAEKSRLAEEIVDVNNLNQQLTVVNEELKSLQKAKLEEVEELKNQLETTTSQWNALISSAALEIDQLKTAKMLVEVELAKELAEKSRLVRSLEDVELQLAASEQRVSSLGNNVSKYQQDSYLQSALEESNKMRDSETNQFKASIAEVMASESICLQDDNNSLLSDFDVTTFNATAHLEHSVLVSDLPSSDRTVIGDNIDPLSLTFNPNVVVTPRKIDSDDDGSDEFATPQTKSWESNGSLDGSVGKTSLAVQFASMKNRDLSVDVEELQKKVKSYEEDLVALRAKADEASKSHEQLSQVMSSIETFVRSILQTFYNQVPELPVEQNIFNLSKDIADITRALIEKIGGTQSCLMDAVNNVIADSLPVSSLLKCGIANAKTQMTVISNSVLGVKGDLEQFYRSFSAELSSTNLFVEQNLKDLAVQMNLKNEAIEELKGTNDALRTELLTASSEKETLRNQLNDEISRLSLLKCSVEEKLKEFETKCDDLKEELDENVSRKNMIENVVVELLQQWDDGDGLRKDVIQDLKSAFGEAIAAKKIIKERLNKNIYLPTDIEDILSKNQLLEDSLSKSKSQLNNEYCKLTATMKNIRNENEQLLLDYSSSQREIEEYFLKIQSALGDWSDWSGLERKLEEFQDRINTYENSMRDASSKYSLLSEKVKLLEENNSSLSSANDALVKDVNVSETKNKELFQKLEELKASNGSLVAEMAKLQGNIFELNEKLSEKELEFSATEKQKVDECSNCEHKDLELKKIRDTIESVIDSTSGRPVDLSGAQNDVVEKLVHSRDVLSQTNDVLFSIMKLLNFEELAGVVTLERLYRRLENNDFRDAYLCKMKFADEIHCLDPDLSVEELLQLSFLELQRKLVSVVMEKEALLIANFKADYENKLASQAHELNQFKEKIKYSNEVIKDQEKEIVKLEQTLSGVMKVNSAKEAGDFEKFNHEQEKGQLTREIESLEAQLCKLQCQSEESATKLKLWICEIENNLKKFSDLLMFDETTSGGNIDFDINNEVIPSNVSDILRGMFSKLCDMRQRFVCISEKSKADALAAKECLINKQTSSKLVELQEELSTKVLTLSKLEVDYANLERQLEIMKENISSKDGEIALMVSTKSNLESELLQCRKRVEELQSQSTSAPKRNLNVIEKLQDVSQRCKLVKVEVLSFQKDMMAENERIIRSFLKLGEHYEASVKEVKNKSNLLETELENVRVLLSTCQKENTKLSEEIAVLESAKRAELENMRAQLSTYQKENFKLSEEIAVLESAKRAELENMRVQLSTCNKENSKLSEEVVVLENAKRALLEQLKKPERGHDDKSCPHKEKAMEYKKELWIIRQKSVEEQNKFDVMKKNIEEDLAFKNDIIKKLEERNETAASRFNDCLASSTASYNQACKQLKEAEEKIAFLRDMHSQDKKRLEKDIENLTKEIVKLQSSQAMVNSFMQELGIDSQTMQDKLPEIKKMLSEYENLKTSLNEMTEKNEELDWEGENMLKRINYLETAYAEMCREKFENSEKIEKLEKELSGNLELVERCKQLQSLVDSLKACETELIKSSEEYKLQIDQLMEKLSKVEQEKSEIQSAYKLLETNFENQNQKILHHLSKVNKYELMIEEKTKANQELLLAVNEERSKCEELVRQKCSLEQNLIVSEEMISKWQSQLKEVSARLQAASSLETDLQKALTERQEAINSYDNLKSVSQELVRKKENQLESLRLSYNQLATEKKDIENILKAKENELIAQIESLKAEAFDKATRIVQLESLMQQSTAPVDTYKTKISSLEDEVKSLKKELTEALAAGMSRPPQHVSVKPASLSNRLDTNDPVGDYQKAIGKLEKQKRILEKVCRLRQEKLIVYQEILRHHKIPDPNASREDTQ